MLSLKVLNSHGKNKDRGLCYSHRVCSKEHGLPRLRKYSGEKRQLELMEQNTRELHGELESSGAP